MLISALTFAVVLLISCDPALSRTEAVNKEAASALYTLAQSCTYYNCPDNWPPRAAGRASCYLYSSEQVEWNDAKSKCASLGGQLVAFETEAEIGIVKTFLQSYYGVNNNPWVWTGLNDRDSEGRYKWTGFGGELSKNSGMWNPNQPDNHSNWWDFFSSGEDCVEYNGSRLNDQQCDADRPFVCEFHP